MTDKRPKCFGEYGTGNCDTCGYWQECQQAEKDHFGIEEIESLRQQLAECHKEVEEQARVNGMGSEREARLMAKLAECPAREKVLRDVLELSWSCTYVDGVEARKKANEALAMPFDSTALDEAIKQGQREKLLEAANRFIDLGEYFSSEYVARELRRMAEELK